MSGAQQLLAGGSSSSVTYVDDVFNVYLRDYASGSSQTVTTGIDMSTYGGMVWAKERAVAGYNHHIFTTGLNGTGAYKNLKTNLTNAIQDLGSGVTSFTTTGFVTDAGGGACWDNSASGKHVLYSFRKAPRFFDCGTYVGDGVAGREIPHNLGVTPGMIIVKNVDSSTNWRVWHRGSSGNYLNLNLTDAAAADPGTLFGNDSVQISPTSTVFTVGSNTGVNSNTGQTHVWYAFAHDTSTDGIIQCGSYSGNNTTNSINLGWEPQYVMVKRSVGATDQWVMLDVMRGLTVGTSDNALCANTSTSEAGDVSVSNAIRPTATGFDLLNANSSLNASGGTYIYLAIRRPNKPPTSGTQVYNAIARTGTGAAATVTGVGFAPDFGVIQKRSGNGPHWEDKLRGATKRLKSSGALTESTDLTALTAFGMDGVSFGADSTNAEVNASSTDYVNWFFRRAPGVMAQICYTGTGSNKTESHGLEAIPELWLVKGRSGATEWVWGSSLLANTQKIVMPSPNGVVTDATAWNSAYPTSTAISLGTAATVNTNTATYSCWMWATLAGISKVFTYTGDGGSGKVINCGFSAGARFVLIIRTTASTAQDIFIWDSARGIIAGNDPHLSLNTAAAEVTTDDSIDPDNSGFAVNQVAATNINVNGAVYIGVAYA